MSKKHELLGITEAKVKALEEIQAENFREEVEFQKQRYRQRKKSGFIKSFITSFKKAFKEARKD